MIDLSTDILGIKINNPIVIASSPLTESMEAILKCEEYGAGAVIAKSCSSTRLNQKGFRRCLIDEKGWWAASTYDREIQDVNEAVKYISASVMRTSIPIFASVSELSLDVTKWLTTCQIVQETGVAGIQMDLFYFENLLGDPNFKVKLIELLNSLSNALSIPIFPKLNVNLPSLYMADILRTSQIKNVSILDSISLPSPISLINGGSLKMRYAKNIRRASLFGAWQFPLTMKYLYDLQLEGFSVCAGGGIQESQDIIELLLLGAQAVQIATSVILGGYRKITEYISGIERYMNVHNLQKIIDLRGCAISQLIGETSYQKVTVEINRDLCTGCNKCVSQCFCNAIKNENSEIVINETLCEGCSLCVDLCPSRALYLI